VRRRRREVYRCFVRDAVALSRKAGYAPSIFIMRDYFRLIGGYREMPLMEDVDLMRRIKREGRAIFIIPEKLRTSGRRWNREGVVRCCLRNWMIMLLYLTGVSPQKLARRYPPP